jgi:hypothetical protein
MEVAPAVGHEFLVNAFGVFTWSHIYHIDSSSKFFNYSLLCGVGRDWGKLLFWINTFIHMYICLFVRHCHVMIEVSLLFCQEIAVSCYRILSLKDQHFAGRRRKQWAVSAKQNFHVSTKYMRNIFSRVKQLCKTVALIVRFFLGGHMFNNPLISGWIQDIKTAKENSDLDFILPLYPRRSPHTAILKDLRRKGNMSSS